MRFILGLLSRIPLDVLYAVLSRPLFDWGYHIFRWRRRLAAANIARAFPDLPAETRAAILKVSYRNLCDLVAEVIWSYGATPAQIRERVTVENPEVVRDRIRAGRSVLLMTAHFCNWEWQVLAGNTELDEPDVSCLQAAARRRDRSIPGRGAQPIRRDADPAHDAHARAPAAPERGPRLRHRRRSDARARRAKYWTTFLHQDSAFFVGADAIARILKATVVFVTMRRIRRGYYTMRVSVLDEPPYDRGADTQVIEHYVRALEAEIRSSPADWLWSHRKWKYPKPGAGGAR
jgi:KDO2-lipid IV(A) lauroyltransferase